MVGAAAVDNVVDDLEARLGGQPTGQSSATTEDGVDHEAAFVRDLFSEEEAQQRKAGGAAQAASSWGSWRIKAPSDASARAHHVLVDTESKA
eukprot:3830138-Prymnesium_polylepis.1